MTDQLKTLKAEYEAAYVRMANALLYPETREAVDKALGGFGQGLAARRQDYNNAFYAYDNALTTALNS